MATTTYADTGLTRLRATAQDASDLAQVLADPGIGGFAVSSAIDQPAHEIRLAIDDFLAERGTRDLVLVYLSCHGLLDARRRLYFAATDTRKDRLGATGIESAWILDELEHCRARSQILILDSCFSGAFAHSAKGDAGLDLGDRFFGQGRGRVVMTASSATEYSFEGQPTDPATPPGSVFTSALVTGLRTGAPDTDHDGIISVDDAYAYVFDQIQAAGIAQTPERWLYGAEGRIVLARNPAGRIIAPGALPESLRLSLCSEYIGVRIGAVDVLGEWLTSGDPAREATARQYLRQVVETEHPRVADAARDLLNAGPDASLRAAAGHVPIESASPAARVSPVPPARHRTSRDDVVIDVTEATFEKEVLDRSRTVPVIMHLWAEWCRPCKQLDPALERLAAEAAGAWVLARVDVDANPQLAAAMQVQSIPTVVGVIGGQLVPGFLGALPEAQLREWLGQVLQVAKKSGLSSTGGEPVAPPPPDMAPDDGSREPELTEARAAIERGDLDGAAAAFERMVANSPGDPVATQGLAQVNLFRRVFRYDAARARRDADARPGDVGAQIKVADIDMSLGKAEEAFDRLLGVIGRTSGENRNKARLHLLGLFEIFPRRDRQVIKARNALYDLDLRS